MSGPDGFEQRTADAQERSWTEDERLDALEDEADTAIDSFESDLLDIAERRLNSDLGVLL